MYNKLIKKLVSIAKVKGYTVQFEAYGIDNNAELYRYSELLYNYKKIIVYYNTDFIKLVVLCHEIGHILHNDLIKYQYSKHIAWHEYNASLWALKFLKQVNFDRILEAKALLNKSLKNYGAKLL
jgi:hypothetical protein